MKNNLNHYFDYKIGIARLNFLMCTAIYSAPFIKKPPKKKVQEACFIEAVSESNIT